MALFGFIAAPGSPLETTDMMRRGARYALVGLGVLIILIGIPLAFVPWLHPGIFLIAAGLVIVLKNSFSARRTFIKAQRRHPNILFPLRRLIRRKPEVVPVFWQQFLRFERLVLRRGWRFLRRIRLMLMRRRRSA
jgi:hypothetical protein